MAFLPYEREVAAPGPRRSADNAYPYAAERILSLFADPTRSPDLAVVHTPRHWFPDEGGHVGEHGSLDVIQSRAPLVLSGRRGRSGADSSTSHARLVDVGPTLATWPACPRRSCATPKGAPLDGARAHGVPRGGGPARRAGWSASSGTARHCGDLLHLAEAGELPGVRRLIERGAGAARRRGRRVPEHHADQPHLDPHRARAGAARGAGQRVLRPRDRRAGRAQRRRRPGTAAPSGCGPAVRTVFEMVNDHVAAARSPADRLRRRGDRPRGRLRHHGADPRQREQQRRRRPRRPAAGPGRLAVPAATRRTSRTATSAGACRSTTSGCSRCCSCGQDPATAPT